MRRFGEPPPNFASIALASSADYKPDETPKKPSQQDNAKGGSKKQR